jgi:hypothetical protein
MAPGDHSGISDTSGDTSDTLSGVQHPGEAFETDAEDLRSKPVDIACALNFSVYLLHSRSEVLTYFQHVRLALSAEAGGILVLDVMGGHTVERSVTLIRRNPVTGASFDFEQERFNPISRRLRAYLTLHIPGSKQVRIPGMGIAVARAAGHLPYCLEDTSPYLREERRDCNKG